MGKDTVDAAQQAKLEPKRRELEDVLRRVGEIEARRAAGKVNNDLTPQQDEALFNEQKKLERVARNLQRQVGK